MVLSILTCFMITSFAAGEGNDITIDNVTYNYNNKTIQPMYLKIELLNKDYSKYKLLYNDNNILLNSGFTSSYTYNTVVITKSTESNSIYIYYYNDSSSVYSDVNSMERTTPFYFIYTAGIKISYSSNNQTYTELSNELYPDVNQYMYFKYDGTSNYNYICNNIEPSINDKVTDFLTYLSTSLNKLTTMIITNQILILFIVAVPVVSFVIGSFKRIKDSGRV